MAIEIVMPRMGLTMEEGTVVNWLKSENQPVTAGEPLLEIETDKSTVEIESPSSGTLSRILVQPGQTVPVGAVVGYLAAAGEILQDLHSPVPSSISQTPFPPANVGESDSLQKSLSNDAAPQKVKASPAARHLARQFNVDLGQVEGSGPGGRVVAWNVRSSVAASQAAQVDKISVLKASPLAQKVAQDLAVDLATVQGTGPGGRVTRQDVERAVQAPASAIFPSPGDSQFEQLPLTRPQRIMAERMSASFHSAPHFYLHVEVNARRLVELRSRLLPRVENQFGVRLTYTDFLVKYSGLILLRHPRMLQQWGEGGLLQAKGAHVGIAIDTPSGLMVPVVRDVDRLGLVEIARRRIDLTGRAQSGKLQPQDLELGVFTITNLGMYGIDSFDAILNPPQAAILAVGRIKERAVVEDGQVTASPMMNLSLSVDHRVLDGAAAARFMSDLVELLENPELAQV